MITSLLKCLYMWCVANCITLNLLNLSKALSTWTRSFAIFLHSFLWAESNWRFCRIKGGITCNPPLPRILARIRGNPTMIWAFEKGLKSQMGKYIAVLKMTMRKIVIRFWNKVRGLWNEKRKLELVKVKSIHFKNTVEQSSVLSKSWWFPIIHQLKTMQSLH